MIRVRYNVRTLLIVSTIVASFFGGLQTRRTVVDSLKADLSRARAEADMALFKMHRAELNLRVAQLELDLVKVQNRSLSIAADRTTK